MSVFENLTKKVTETAKAAARKSGDIVEVTKLNVAISSEEERIQKEYTNIGKVVFDSFGQGAEVSNEVSEICQRIKACEENIEAMKQKILELKSIKLCPNCLAELEIDVAYCPKCGTKQEIPDMTVSSAEEDSSST